MDIKELSRFSEEKKNKIILLKNLMFSAREIEALMGISNTQITDILRREHIKYPKADRRTHLVDDNFFSIIDTEVKAYALGFIMTDGNICGKTISISQKIDGKPVLERILKEMHSDYTITEFANNSNWGSPDQVYCQFSINSEKMRDDLYRLNVTERKSFTLEPPCREDIPEDLIHHLVRGIFDGDGSIWVSHAESKTSPQYHMEFKSTYKVLEFVEEAIGITNKIYSAKLKSGREGIYRISIGGNKRIAEMYDYLYKDATIFLERKRDKFLEVKKLRVRK